MLDLELTLDSKGDTLAVHRFAVEEAVSGLFCVSVWAASRSADVDLEPLVGRPAALRVVGGLPSALVGARRWTGICRTAEVVSVELQGESRYFFEIVPLVWALTQRENHRLFQHLSVPDIADRLLGEWGVAPVWKLDRAAYPELELRTQYGESDWAFLCRLFEEEGISYLFVDDPEKGTELVLADGPQRVEPRAGEPLPFVDAPNRSTQQEYVTDLTFVRSARTGRVVLRDHDFRRRPDVPVSGESAKLDPPSLEDRFERFAYRPGLSLVDVEPAAGREQDRKAGTRPGGRGAPAGGAAALGGVVGFPAPTAGTAEAPAVAARVVASIAAGVGPSDVLVGDDRGTARHVDAVAARHAADELASRRAVAREIRFATNALDLAPGVVFAVRGHPRRELAGEGRLLVVHATLEGTSDGELHQRCRAVLAAPPYRPERRTPRPVVHGVQSALVVGPPGEEIHADELGRVRVQLPWDREGAFDDKSSCWMRVSQGWAGAGYGLFTVPRVGHEVLVAFLDGNPDLPLVVGRVHGGTTPVPYPLPASATKSGLRTRSSPGGEGFNELMFEDAKDQELVSWHAQRDAQEIVERERGAVIGRNDAVHVGARQLTRMAVSPTGLEMVDDRITLTTGGATVVLHGADVTIWARSHVTFRSTGAEVNVQGGPDVKLNCGVPVGAPAGLPAGSASPRPRKGGKDRGRAKGKQSKKRAARGFPPEIIKAAQDSQRKTGVPASITLSQWALESNWGADMPEGSNNPFGIKARPGEPSVATVTHEEYGGVRRKEVAGFRKYESLEEAFEKHGELLSKGKPYKAAMAVADDPDAMARALQGTYATDSRYAAKLQGIMRDYDLYQYDVLPPE